MNHAFHDSIYSVEDLKFYPNTLLFKTTSHNSVYSVKDKTLNPTQTPYRLKQLVKPL